RAARRAGHAHRAADRSAHLQPGGPRVVPAQLGGGRGGGRDHRRVRAAVVPARTVGHRGAWRARRGRRLRPAGDARPGCGYRRRTRDKTILAARAWPRKGRVKMRIGMALNYAGGFAETVEELGDYEKAGLEIVFVPEAYSFD